MRGKVKARKGLKPDAVYGSKVVSKLINYVMQDGKKVTAEKIVYQAMENLDLKDLAKYKANKQAETSGKFKKSKKSNDDDAEKKDKKKKVKVTPLEALEGAIANAQPKNEIRSRRIGGANYQIPVPVQPSRQIALALRWMVDAMRSSRGSQPSYVALKNEIEAAFKNEGASVKKKEDVHKMAEANKAFAQFA
jgi:small subunit ribosomal protein S7